MSDEKNTNEHVSEMPELSVPQDSRGFSLTFLSDLDTSDIDLRAASDQAYREITQTIVDKTVEHLEKQNTRKETLRSNLAKFIKCFLSIQFAVLCLVLAFNKGLNISDTVISAFIVSVFAETLAGLIVMVKYAFDSEQEVKLIEILNSVVQNYQKVTESLQANDERAKGSGKK